MNCLATHRARAVLLTIILLACLSPYARAGEFSFKDHKLCYDGYVVDTHLNVTKKNMATDSGALAVAVGNKFNRQKILEILSPEGKMDLWLFDPKSKKKLFKIDTLGAELDPTWISPKYIEASRSQFGQSISYIYKIRPIAAPFRKSKPIANLLSFNPDSGYLVRYSSPGLKHPDDRVIVRKVFSQHQKAFSIKMKYTDATEALFMFQDVHIKHRKLYISLQQGGKIKRMQFDLDAKGRKGIEGGSPR